MLPGKSLRPFFQFVVDIQPEDITQHLFTPGRRLPRELVGVPLAEVGAVDKGIVVHVQDVPYLGLRLRDGVAGDGTEPVAVAYLEFERRLAGTRPLFGSGTFAYDAVKLCANGKLELHLHFRLRGVDEVVVAGGTGFTPERPGHRVDDSRLAVAVVAGEAGEMDTGEIQRWDVVPVAHEVAHGEFDGYHLDLIVA